MIYMYLSNNPSSGEYKFVEFALLMNKTSTKSLIFYFDKAKQKNVCSGYMKK